MAKKVQGTHVEHKVTTKGLKEVERDAKKAGKGFNTLDKNARNADRGMKGAANMSSGASKNFSKLSQGITGGLVPAYATLAANLFALDAVFRFLKDSADFRVLKEGQLAFAAATGVAYESLARDLQAATNGMINFRDAAQAGAIGRAAGLSAGQLTELSAAARTVSIALGRDVTDSFNRLVRGVTKAEPELLDELGIILRLDEATTKYAASLGLNKNQLSIYQKSQAVVNEVLGQAERKFGKINEIMEIQDNSISQLGIAFEEAIDNMRPFIAGFAEFFAKFGKDNIDVLTFAIIGFAGGIVKSVIPATHELKAAEKARSEAFIADQNRIKAALEEVRLKKLQVANVPVAQSNFAIFAGQTGNDFGKIGEDLQAGKNLSRHQRANLRSQFNKGIGGFKGLDEKQMKVAEAMLDDIDKSGGIVSEGAILRGKELGLQFDELKLKGSSAIDKITGGFEKFAGMAMRALSVISTIVAVGSVIFMIGKALVNFIRRDEIERARKFNEELEKQTDSAQRLNKELRKMGEVRKAGLLSSGAETDIFIGNAIQSANLEERVAGFEMLAKQADTNREGFGQLKVQLLGTFTAMADIDERFEKFRAHLEVNTGLTEKLKEELKELTKSILTVKAAQETLNETEGEFIKAQNRLIQSLPKVPYQDIIELLQTQGKAYIDLVKEGKDYEAHLKRVLIQLELFTRLREQANALKKADQELALQGATDFLAGDPNGARRTAVDRARLKLQTEIQKTNDLILNIKTAEQEKDSTKLASLMLQADYQASMVGNAKALLDLEKLRADQMAMTYNDLYLGIEKDLGAAIGKALRGDSSGFADIGKNLTKGMTDAIGKFLSEQFLEDIIPDDLKPDTVGDEIINASQKQAFLVKKAIQDGAFIQHALITDGMSIGSKQIDQIMTHQNTTLQRLVIAMDAASGDVAAQEAQRIQAEIDKEEVRLARASFKSDPAKVRSAMLSGQDVFDAEGNLIFSPQAEMEKFAQENLSGKDLDAFIKNKSAQASLRSVKQQIASKVDDGSLGAYSIIGRMPDGTFRLFEGDSAQGARRNMAQAGATVADHKNRFGFTTSGSTMTTMPRSAVMSDFQNETGLFGQLRFQTSPKALDPTPGYGADANLQHIIDRYLDLNDTQENLINNSFGFLQEEEQRRQTIFDLEQERNRQLQLAGLEPIPDAGSTPGLDDNVGLFNQDGSINKEFLENFSGSIVDLQKAIDDNTEDPTTVPEETSVDKFSKGLNQFSGVIGMMGALTGEEEKTAKIMATAAKIQLMVAIYQRAQMALKEGSGFFGVLGKFFTGSTTGRQGGIMSKHGRSYSHGGVAEGPSSGYGAILHGREAVVPLPNGRAIPVEMAGGGKMNTNNTNITVNIDETGATGKVDSEGGAELGVAIQGVVQAELERQMRPGGILGS